MSLPNKLTGFARLSVAAALATIGIKALAYQLTGSVGLFSDAVESLVNLAGACMALWMLAVAARPADEEHAYGHTKAEYFASGFEGALIILAAGSILWAALPRFSAPQPLEQVGWGLIVALLATAINLAVALVLLRAGRRHQSITLEANARHLLTDVWTSAGVVLAVALVPLTGWLWLDPLLALLVALNILRTGTGILRRSISGLMDPALGGEDKVALEEIFKRCRQEGIDIHGVLTRQAGARKFVSFHVLVPGVWSVQQAHERVERLETEVREKLGRVHVLTHLEPLEDPLSFNDQRLD